MYGALRFSIVASAHLSRLLAAPKDTGESPDNEDEEEEHGRSHSTDNVH